MTTLIAPHGGILKERLLAPEAAQPLKRSAHDLPSWDLTPRQLCDIELLLNGGFSPLEGFMIRANYESVVKDMRLSNGLLWPIPIPLDVTEAFAQKIGSGSDIALRDPEGVLIAVMRVSDLWRPDRTLEARHVYGTPDPDHPGVDLLLNRTHPVYIGGPVTGLELPSHHDFKSLRDTPRELRERFARWGWRRVAAYPARDPIHRAHHELTLRAAQLAKANLLIHPIVGLSRPEDHDYYARIRCYQHILHRYPEQTTALSLLPLVTRPAGPREALWLAVVRKNYACSHLVVENDPVGSARNRPGTDYYNAAEIRDLLVKHQQEIGIEMLPLEEMIYVQERAGYVPSDQVEAGQTVLKLSEEEFDRRLREGLEVPEWFSYPDVVEELRKTRPPRYRQGFTVFFTGLSGAGKSTIANALMVKLMEMGGRPITLLDGDVVRKHLSSELGFSRAHRDLNILRIGFVASEITKNGGVAICAPIAPYRETRRKVREMIAARGGFIEVHVATPLEVCESRDRKGLYAKARAGIIKEFTGISDPYEVPEKPELTIDTQDDTPDEAAQRILLELEGLGYIR